MRINDEIKLDVNRIRELLTNLQELTNLRFSLHTIEALELVTANRRSDFCNLICQTQYGYRKCFNSDLKGINAAKELEKPYQYRCHAGIIDTAIPIYNREKLEAIILFGQILDDSPLEDQWRVTERNCAWHSDMFSLKKAFHELPRLSTRAIRAAYEIINTCVNEVRLAQIVLFDQMSDFERLGLYLKTHYAEDLTAEVIANGLAISKSRLYRMIRECAEGKTLNMLITEERIYAAKKMLKKTSAPIREIGAHVGIVDYNYFTKVFRRYTGRTPSAYRAEKILISVNPLHEDPDLNLFEKNYT